MLSLSPGPSVHASPLVEATRSTPSYSDIANWPIRRPGTSPLAAYSVCAGIAGGVEAVDRGLAGLLGRDHGRISGPMRRPIELTTPSSGGAILSVAT